MLIAGLSAFKDKSPGYFKIESGETKEVFIPLEIHEMTRAVVHSSPSNFMKSAFCTWEDNELCYACEQGTFAWGGRVKIFIPIIESGSIKIMNQGTGKNSLIWPLGDLFYDEGSSVGWFLISREGNGKRSKYSAKRIDNKPLMKYNKKVDLSGHLKKIAYEGQETYYS